MGLIWPMSNVNLLNRRIGNGNLRTVTQVIFDVNNSTVKFFYSFPTIINIMKTALVLLGVVCLYIVAVSASSHSEAPGTSRKPSADITDVYAFRSYETLRDDYTTLIVNAQGLQDPFAGPNYYSLSDNHFYEIYVDNDGDAKEDFTFQFLYGNRLGGDLVEVPFDECDEGDCFTSEVGKRNFGPQPLTSVKHGGLTLNIAGKDMPVALKIIGVVTIDNNSALNWFEYYSINLIQGDRDFGVVNSILETGTGNNQFSIPFDYSGTKAFPDYETYARQYIYDIDIPNCNGVGRVFVGQRAEPFYINIGPIFDLVNFVPIPGFPGAVVNNPANNGLGNKNIDTFALEIPTVCLTGEGEGIIGVWAATRELHHVGDAHVAGKQFSRLGNPLVNELFIGLRDKQRYNKITPSEDLAWGLEEYLQYPTFPAILNILFLDAVNAVLGTSLDTIAPTNFPRDDLYATFFTGIATLNQPTNVVPGEMMRLNTNIAPTPAESQNNMGVINGDNAGYPNGRRPGDDSIDISLRVAMGRLCTLNLYCTPADAVVGGVDLLDGAPISALDF